MRAISWPNLKSKRRILLSSLLVQFRLWQQQHIIGQQHRQQQQQPYYWVLKMKIKQIADFFIRQIKTITIGKKKLLFLDWNSRYFSKVFVQFCLWILGQSFSMNLPLYVIKQTRGRIFSQAGIKLIPSWARTLWENKSKPRSYLGTSSFPAWLKIRPLNKAKI